MANEQLYRRMEDGSFVPHEKKSKTGLTPRFAPEARGKAAAFDSWLSQSGNISRVSNVYRQGPMKGKTYDEAKQQFETMWAGAPDAVKEKYAGRVNTDLAPSERKTVATLAMTPGEVETEPFTKSELQWMDQRMGITPVPTAEFGSAELTAKVKGGQGEDATEVPQARGGQRRTMEMRSTDVGAEGLGARQGAAPGSDEARRMAFEENQGNERYAIADNGDGAMRAAVAMDKKNGGHKLGSNYNIKDGYKFGYNVRDDLEAVANGMHGRGFAPNSKPSSAPVASTSTAPKKGQGRVGGTSVSGQSGKISSGASPSAGAPASSGVTADKPMRAANIAAAGGDMNKLSTDDRMAAQPKTFVTRPEPRVNKLTGLPFGYNPGDAVDGKFKMAADASVARQSAASAAAVPAASAPVATKTQTKPVYRSALDNPANAFSKESYARTAAAQAEGVRRQAEASRAVNQDDPKKFFTGQVKPLDQLVANRSRGVATSSL